MSSVHLKGVTKSYGAQDALSGISLDIHDGEFMVLVGPSGCGKSTILRSIAGLEDVSRGDIYIGETRVNTLPPHKRDVAMVFQNYALYPNLTVFENIAFPLRAARAQKATIQPRVQAVAERLGLETFLQRKPRALSGGQRQRVAIARAIIRNPQVFLMDEPLSNLDAKLRGHMRTEILRLQRQLGTTTVFVTHDQVEAMTMGDRIAIIDGGQVQQIGTPFDVYYRPANTFVAGFLGSPAMNLVPGHLEADRNDMQLVLGGAGVFHSVVAAQLPVQMSGRSLIVGIRPEDMTGVESDHNGIPGQVELVEYLGSETVLTVDAAGQEWRVKWSGHHRIARGAHVHLSADRARIYLFDAHTTALIGTLDDVAAEKTDKIS